MTISITNAGAAPGPEALLKSSGPINEGRVAELVTELLHEFGEDPAVKVSATPRAASRPCGRTSFARTPRRPPASRSPR